MRYQAILSTLMLCPLITGCASTYDPETVCTADWVSARADIAVERIESRTRASMKTLLRATDTWAKGGTPGPFQLLALSSSLKALEKELKNGRGMQDLRRLANTCNDPEIVSEALGGFMRDQGLSDRIIDFIERTDAYQALLIPSSSS